MFTETGVTPALNIHAKNFRGTGTDMSRDFTHTDEGIEQIETNALDVTRGLHGKKNKPLLRRICPSALLWT